MYAHDNFCDGLSYKECLEIERDRWVETVKEEYDLFLLDFPCKGECSDECEHQSFDEYLSDVGDEYEAYLPDYDEELYG